MKLLVAASALLLAATPAQALTWKEFWEPFDGEHHHGHVHHYHHHAPRPQCKVTRTRKVWVEGYYTGFYEAPGRPEWIPGRWTYKTRTRWVPCHRYH